MSEAKFMFGVDGNCCEEGCACTCCGTKPDSIQLVIGGVANSTCTDCTSLNGTWLLSKHCCSCAWEGEACDPDDPIITPAPADACFQVGQFGETDSCGWRCTGPSLCGNPTRIEVRKLSNWQAVVYYPTSFAARVAWTTPVNSYPCSTTDTCELTDLALNPNASASCANTTSTCLLTTIF